MATHSADQQNRCIAYLLCDTAPQPEFGSLRTAMAKRFPSLSKGMELLSPDLFEGAGYAFVVGGVVLSVIVVPASLPSSEWQAGAVANLTWPDAAKVIGAHRAHIILSPVAAISDRRDALVKFTVLTAVSAVLADCVGASGICWSPAFTLIESGALQALANAMMIKDSLGALPLDLWMRLEFGRARESYAVMTTGLRSLIDLDIVVIGSEKNPHRQAAIVYDVAAYMIKNDVTINDGDKLEVGSGRVSATVLPESNLLKLQQIGVL